jgi:hypothetical protein
MTFPGRVDHAYRAWIRTLGCEVMGESCSEVMHACHLVTRGHGAYDWGNLVPLCAKHHSEQHTGGITGMADRYGVNLWRSAVRLYQLWLQHDGARR